MSKDYDSMGLNEASDERTKVVREDFDNQISFYILAENY